MMTNPTRWRRLSWVRQVRSRLPMLTRLTLLLALAWVSGVPSLWAPLAGLPGVPGAQAGSVDLAPGIYQVDGTPTPTSTLDPSMIPPPVETPTPTTAVPPPVPPTAPAPPAAPASPSPQPYTGVSDPCWGDEQITYVPESPRAPNELIIVVTSSRPHTYGRVAGTEKATFIRERPGQLGYVWEWSVQLTWPGRHEYTFYVDSTIPCKKIEILVRQQLFTKTPTPTKTGNDNDN
ncbi:MAG: hypothetical protein U0893_21000 [Chloroflexota bacterium]